MLTSTLDEVIDTLTPEDQLFMELVEEYTDTIVTLNALPLVFVSSEKEVGQVSTRVIIDRINEFLNTITLDGMVLLCGSSEHFNPQHTMTLEIHCVVRE
jgi:hypothetical protein